MHSAARTRLRKKEVQAEEELRGKLTSNEVPIDPMRMCKEIADFVTDDMILIGDGGRPDVPSDKLLPGCWSADGTGWNAADSPGPGKDAVAVAGELA